MRIRNLGRKSLEEVLRKAQEKGYPADEAVERYVAELRNDPEATYESIQSWEALRNRLRLITSESPVEPEIHEGIPLESLEGMPALVS